MDPLVGFGACLLLIAMLVVYIFFLMSMSQAISLCSRRNRAMEPGLVWLGLIPIFHAIWLFVIVATVAKSLGNEYRDRRLSGGGSYGQALGMISGALYLVSFVFNLIGNFNPDFNLFVALPFGLVVLGCWIAYWIQIAGYSRRLAGRGRYDDDYDDDDYDDDYDDRPRRGRRRRDDDYDDDYDDRGGRPWDRGR